MTVITIDSFSSSPDIMDSTVPTFTNAGERRDDEKEPITWIQGYSDISGRELNYDVVIDTPTF